MSVGRNLRRTWGACRPFLWTLRRFALGSYGWVQGYMQYITRRGETNAHELSSPAPTGRYIYTFIMLLPRIVTDSC